MLDLVGGETLRRTISLVRPEGRIVTTLSEAAAGVRALGCTIAHVKMRATTADLNAIAALADENELIMPIARTVRFDEIPAVLDEAGSWRRDGKVVAMI